MLQIFYEKLVLGAATLVAVGFGTLSAILTEGEFRWLSITITSSLITAMFCAVIVRAPTETMKVTVCRAGIGILAGILATREAVIHWGIDAFERDAVRLAGAAAVMTIVGMTVGYFLIMLLNSKGKDLAKRWLDKWTGKE